MIWLITLVLVFVALAAITRLFLDGEDLSRYDNRLGDAPPVRDPSEAHFEAVRTIRDMQQASGGGGLASGQRLKEMRATVDEMGLLDDPELRFEAVSANGVAAEWVLAPNSDPKRRFLYLHGGAYMIGSPRSHRKITARLARLADAAVLSVDYRLMPEHARLAGIEDCRAAYRWILENGPEGHEPLEALFVAGDSAGGNLTLSTVAWARDAKLRAANAVIALSPHTDTCMASPSLEANLETDHMLGPMFATLTRIPRGIALWTGWWSNRMAPKDPRISPLRGDLSNLPPTLVHASEAEVLLDDARRYVARAVEAGSDARLSTWHHQLHVWHLFEGLPEADEAYADIASFIEEFAPRASSLSSA